MNAWDYKKRPPKRKFKKTLGIEIQKAIKALIITLTLMIVGLGVTFLIMTSENAQKGYTLQQEKIENEKLKNESNDLTTKITQATAFLKIKDSEKVEEMQSTDEENKKYVTSEDNRVK